jgi:hypothetical protein
LFWEVRRLLLTSRPLIKTVLKISASRSIVGVTLELEVMAVSGICFEFLRKQRYSILHS